MKTLSILFTIFITITNVFAQETLPNNTPPVALVHKIIGSAFFDGKEIKMGDSLSKNGLITTSNKSFIQLKIVKWNTSINLGSNSKMELNFASEKKYTLMDGYCRWKSLIRDAVTKSGGGKGKIYTKNVAMGVRGTDFLIKSFPIFGETEIVMFDGEVLMENIDDKENSVVVTKGQWGGLGGRFGKKINPPLDLPKEVLTSFEQLIEAP